MTYTDYGPVYRTGTTGTASGTLKVRHLSTRYMNRPYCDLCGPFRGRELRTVGRDEFGAEHRCRSCDEDGY